MKTLGRIFMAVSAVALTVIGLEKVGGVAITSGYDTGFSAVLASPPETGLALTNEASNLTCWLRLKVPAQAPPASAKLSTGAPLGVYAEPAAGSERWVQIVAGLKPQEQFAWPAGTQIIINGAGGNSRGLSVEDWYVYISDKDYDSRGRSRWRTFFFYLTRCLLPFALIGIAIEAYSKYKGEAAKPFTPQRCVEELINSTEGRNAKETEWMKSILTKVLLEGVPARDALSTIPLKSSLRNALWFRTNSQFRARLNRLIADLTLYQSYL